MSCKSCLIFEQNLMFLYLNKNVTVNFEIQIILYWNLEVRRNASCYLMNIYFEKEGNQKCVNFNFYSL